MAGHGRPTAAAVAAVAAVSRMAVVVAAAALAVAAAVGLLGRGFRVVGVSTNGRVGQLAAAVAAARERWL